MAVIPQRRTAATFAAMISRCLVAVAATLRVPDLGVAATEIGEHRRRDLAGVGAGIVGVDVLGAPADRGSAEPFAGDPDRRERRQDEQVPVVETGDKRDEASRTSAPRRTRSGSSSSSSR